MLDRQWKGIESLAYNQRGTNEARQVVAVSRALLKDGNSLSRPRPKAVLSPVSYRLSRRRRQRKRLLLKVPIKILMTVGPSYLLRFTN